MIGAVLGVIVTLSSIGAGAIGATVLALLYPRTAAVRIVGSDIAHAVPLALIAGLGHGAMGSLDLHARYLRRQLSVTSCSRPRSSLYFGGGADHRWNETCTR